MSIVSFNELRDKAYKMACDHGFHKEDLSDEHFLMLVITELSEVVEADRKDRWANKESYELLSASSIERTGNKEYFNEVAFNHNIKDTVEDELADTVIRLMDLAGLRNINILLTGKWNADLTKMTLTEAVFSIVRELSKSDSSSSLEKNINRSIGKIIAIAEALNIDLFWFVEQKMKYNGLREQKHGKKY